MAAVNPQLEAAYVRAMHGINFVYGEDGLRELYSELKEVLDDYPSLLTYSTDNRSLLMQIAISSHIEPVVRILLDKGYDKSQVLPFTDFNDNDEEVVMRMTAYAFATRSYVPPDNDTPQTRRIIALLNPVENMVLDGGYRKKYRKSNKSSRKSRKSKKSSRKSRKSRRSAKQNF